MNIPEEMILRIKDDQQIRSAAHLEAEITYLKLQSKTHRQTEVIYAYPELLRDKNDLFTFGLAFGGHLANLQSGAARVSEQVKQEFSAKFN